MAKLILDKSLRNLLERANKGQLTPNDKVVPHLRLAIRERLISRACGTYSLTGRGLAVLNGDDTELRNETSEAGA